MSRKLSTIEECDQVLKLLSDGIAVRTGLDDERAKEDIAYRWSRINETLDRRLDLMKAASLAEQPC